MRVFITAATVGEWMPCFLEVDKFYTEKSKRFKVYFHQSGVGMMATCFALTKLIMEEKPDLLLQVEWQDVLTTTVNLGKVVIIEKDHAGDLGVEENGKWKDLFSLKLEKSNYPPYEKSALPTRTTEKLNLLKLKTVTGVTVNEITTRKERIKQLKKKYQPITESMEGAALHYVCRSTGTPFFTNAHYQ
jgi:futalosine hydrolase